MTAQPFSLLPEAGRIAALIAGLSICASLMLATPPAAAQDADKDLVVKFDQSQLYRLEKPAAEIIIGNPAIADVSVQNGNLLVILGKSFGITNIIALDAERNVILDRRIMVHRDERAIVNVYKSAARMTYNCKPQCNPMPMIGDDKVFFETTKSMTEAKMQFSERAADVGGSQAGAQ